MSHALCGFENRSWLLWRHWKSWTQIICLVTKPNWSWFTTCMFHCMICHCSKMKNSSSLGVIWIMIYGSNRGTTVWFQIKLGPIMRWCGSSYKFWNRGTAGSNSRFNRVILFAFNCYNYWEKHFRVVFYSVFLLAHIMSMWNKLAYCSNFEIKEMSWIWEWEKEILDLDLLYTALKRCIDNDDACSSVVLVNLNASSISFPFIFPLV